MFWILFSVFILIVILGIIAIFISKKHKRPVDYYNFFIIGIIWVGAGIPLENYFLLVVGLIFMIYGLINKDKWKENRMKWENLSQKEKKVRIWITIILSLLVLIGLVMFILSARGVL